MIQTILQIGLWIVVAILVIYTIRHYIFTLNRVFGRHRQPYVDIGTGAWPEVVIFVPCHNEEKVIAGMLDALLAADYPKDRYTIVPINDRSTDGTARIIDDYAARHPGRVKPFHRTTGKPGKAAALKDATDRSERRDLPRLRRRLSPRPEPAPPARRALLRSRSRRGRWAGSFRTTSTARCSPGCSTSSARAATRWTSRRA